MSINHVNISGNLTRDPELRTTAGGTNILSFGVAVNDRRKNPQTGKWQDVPNFIDCIVFGQRRSKLEVVVEEIEFLSKSQTTAATAQGQPSFTAPQAPEEELYDSDIPF